MRRALATAAVLVTVSACSGSTSAGRVGTTPTTPTTTAAAGASPTAPAAATPGPPDPERVQVVATGLEVPWGLAFLPGGDALVTERISARVLRIPAKGGTPSEVTRIAEAAPQGEGGLLGLALSPHFAQDDLVYVYVTTAQDNRVLRFRLDAPATRTVVFSGIPKAQIHDGGRIAFGPDGDLYVGTGETGDRPLAQDPASLGGKVLRMTPDGAPPAGSSSVVWSTGHRNVQGLAWDDAGRLYQVEFGQDRFDEVNLLTAGSNGGWPVVEGAGDGGGRFLAPLVTWPTSEASPSGDAVAGGSLWVAALRGQRLWRMDLHSDGTLGAPQALLVGTYGRLRTVARAPDGALWVLTSNRDGRGAPGKDDDRVLRLPPA